MILSDKYVLFKGKEVTKKSLTHEFVVYYV